MDKTDFYAYSDWYRSIAITDNILTVEEMEAIRKFVEETDEFSFHWWPYLD